MIKDLLFPGNDAAPLDSLVTSSLLRDPVTIHYNTVLSWDVLESLMLVIIMIVLQLHITINRYSTVCRVTDTKY